MHMIKIKSFVLIMNNKNIFITKCNYLKFCN